MSQGDIHVGDIGTIIDVTIKEAGVAAVISSATVREFRFQKKDKTTFDKTVAFKTDGTDGILTYTTVVGDIDLAGRWYVQAYLEMPSWEGFTAKVTFQVDEPLPTPP